MKEITFIVDYRGVLTGEEFYTSGTVANLPEVQAVALVEAGRAEYVIQAQPRRKSTPRKKTTSKRAEK